MWHRHSCLCRRGEDFHSRNPAQTEVSVPHLPWHGEGHCSRLKQEKCGTDTLVCAGAWQSLTRHPDSPASRGTTLRRQRPKATDTARSEPARFSVSTSRLSPPARRGHARRTGSHRTSHLLLARSSATPRDAHRSSPPGRCRRATPLPPRCAGSYCRRPYRPGSSTREPRVAPV